MPINPASFQSIPALAAPELPAGPTSMERAFSVLASGMGGITERKGAKKDREAALLNVLLPAFAQQNRLNPVVQGGGGIATPIGNMEIGPVVPKVRTYKDRKDQMDWEIRQGLRAPDPFFIADQVNSVVEAKQKDQVFMMQLQKELGTDPKAHERYWTNYTKEVTKRYTEIFDVTGTPGEEAKIDLTKVPVIKGTPEEKEEFEREWNKASDEVKRAWLRKQKQEEKANKR